jgi:hypothetical protein
VWVIGDLFQQYAAKYIGISRGIPLSNTNQLWGLLWGVLVFGELRGLSGSLYAQVIGGSLLMAAGAGAIAFSSVTAKEHARWKEAADREGHRYGVEGAYVQAALSGREAAAAATDDAGDQDAASRAFASSAPAVQSAGGLSRTWLDYLLVAAATTIFIVVGILARAPNLALNWSALVALVAAMLVFLAACAAALWRTTRFN